MGKRIIAIRDETLRDGAQQPGINLTSKDRQELASLIAEVLDSGKNSVRNQIDLGMPEVSNAAYKVIKNSAKNLSSLYGIDLFVTGRATKEAIDCMASSLSDLPEERRIIAPFIGISQKHREKLGLSKKETLQKIEEGVSYARNLTPRVHFPLEGGFYAYLEEKTFVYDIFSVLSDLGVEAVPFCDTVGTALPFTTKTLSYGDSIRDLRHRYPKIKLSVHCHDDLGLSVANTIDGLLKGADIADGSFFGIGERAGNSSIQTLITLLNEKSEDLELEIHVNLKSLYGISENIRKILKIKIADNTPVVGLNSFTHASGIHQDGVLKNEGIYQPYDPRKIGRKGHEIQLSYLSGKRGINYILQNKYGITLTDDKLNAVAKAFKERVDSKRKPEDELIRVTLKNLSQ